MHTRTILLAAGATAGLAIGVAGPAVAQTSSSQADLRNQLDAQERQIQELKRQIDGLQTVAPASSGKPAPKVVESSIHKFGLESADGQYSIAVTGRLHADVGGYFDSKPDDKAGPINGAPGTLSNGFNVRRGRLGVTGKVAGDWTYNFIYDFGNSQDTTPRGIQSAQFIYNGFKGVAIDLGYSDTFFTLDEATSSNDILFIERSSAGAVATSMNAGDFRANAGVRFYGDRYWVGAYLLGPSSGDSHTLTSERFGSYQRAAFQVLQTSDYTLHLGVAVDELLKSPNTGPGTASTITLSDAPELRIDPTAFLTTGALGTLTHPVKSGEIYNVETAANFRNVFVQGEYFYYNIKRDGLSDAKFNSAYLEGMYTITGESRKYLPGSGAYGTIVPAHPFSIKNGTWGAWEVGARVSYIDLIDQLDLAIPAKSQPGAVDGGRETIFTAGVNWYPNSLVRFMFNYVHTEFDKKNLSVATIGEGVPIGTTLNGIALRSQVIW
jgi:phosphate-selective porin OprO/OprP